MIRPARLGERASLDVDYVNANTRYRACLDESTCGFIVHGIAVNLRYRDTHECHTHLASAYPQVDDTTIYHF